MPLHGHATTWGSHIDVGRSRHTKGWYPRFKEWWAAHKAKRQEAQLAALRAQWDAKREVVASCRAEAAPEMAVSQHALSVATMLYGLSE